MPDSLSILFVVHFSRQTRGCNDRFDHNFDASRSFIIIISKGFPNEWVCVMPRPQSATSLIDATETHSSTTFPRNTTAGKRAKVVEGGRRRQTDVDESAHAFGWFVC